MKNNTRINSRLIDLLEVLDARATINIFVETDGVQKSVKYLKVYEFLSEPELTSNRLILWRGSEALQRKRRGSISSSRT